MRRMIACLLALMLVFGCGALAYGRYDACDLAYMLAEYMPDMVDIKQMPLDYAPDRAIWYDGWTDAKCALVVCGDDVYAEETALMDSTRDTAAYAVRDCVLYIPRILGAELMLDYRLALADLLGVRIDDDAADYILNGSSHKFHYPECSKVHMMNAENIQAYGGDRETLLYCGYEPCLLCRP